MIDDPLGEGLEALGNGIIGSYQLTFFLPSYIRKRSEDANKEFESWCYMEQVEPTPEKKEDYEKIRNSYPETLEKIALDIVGGFFGGGFLCAFALVYISINNAEGLYDQYGIATLLGTNVLSGLYETGRYLYKKTKREKKKQLDNIL